MAVFYEEIVNFAPNINLVLRASNLMNCTHEFTFKFYLRHPDIGLVLRSCIVRPQSPIDANIHATSSKLVIINNLIGTMNIVKIAVWNGNQKKNLFTKICAIKTISFSESTWPHIIDGGKVWQLKHFSSISVNLIDANSTDFVTPKRTLCTNLNEIVLLKVSSSTFSCTILWQKHLKLDRMPERISLLYYSVINYYVFRGSFHVITKLEFCDGITLSPATNIFLICLSHQIKTNFTNLFKVIFGSLFVRVYHTVSS